MTPKPNTAFPTRSLAAALALMKQKGCHQLPVVEGSQLVGIITLREVQTTLLANGKTHYLVAQHMTPDPITVTPDTPAYRAAEILSIYQFGALPVVEHEDLVGIISVNDFLNRDTTFSSSAGGV